MRAARLHAYGQPLQIDEIPRPTPGPGEVVVAVGGAGFCHSDIRVIDGEIPILPRMPLVLGHENAGVVAARGWRPNCEGRRCRRRLRSVGMWALQPLRHRP